MKLAREADIFIYVGQDVDKVLDSKIDVLSQIPAYQNGRFWDQAKRGAADWFEWRYVEPDVVWEEFLSVLYPTRVEHSRVWFRNVQADEQSVPPTECKAEKILAVEDMCVKAVSMTDPHSGGMKWYWILILSAISVIFVICSIKLCKNITNIGLLSRELNTVNIETVEKSRNDISVE